jgi:hypothetical protein
MVLMILRASGSARDTPVRLLMLIREREQSVSGIPLPGRHAYENSEPCILIFAVFRLLNILGLIDLRS